MIEIPNYEHKYICLFDNETQYNQKEPSFEEVNYSAIISDFQTEEDKRDYFPSRRTTNKDNEYVMRYWVTDALKTKFFLEIVWGYFGWEWTDYEYNGEILKGGNLYKVKETTTVNSIIDGYRLQHINNFLNSQDKVITVEWFDVSNIKCANKAFYRLNRIGGLLATTPTPLDLKVKSFPSLVEADRFLVGNTLSEGTYEFPNLENTYLFFVNNNLQSNFKLKFDKLKSFKGGFAFAYAKDMPIIDINSYFTEDSLNNIEDLSYLLYTAFLNTTAWSDSYTEDDTVTINLDLTKTNADSINLDYAFYCIAQRTDNHPYSDVNRTLNINLEYNKPVSLESAFEFAIRRVEIDGYATLEEFSYKFGAAGRFKYLNINFTPEKLALITNLNRAFSTNRFLTDIPITEWNGISTENEIYYKSAFTNKVVYDFSPNKTINNSINQFSSCIFDNGFEFRNVDYLKNVCFTNIQLSTPAEFPHILHNPDLQYNEDGTPYRIIDFSGSGFTNLPDQDIYVEFAYDNEGPGHIFPFKNCKNFIGSRGIKLHYKNLDGVRVASSHQNYNNCTNLVHSPTYYLDIINKPCCNGPSFYFENLQYLESVNLDGVHVRDSYSQYRVVIRRNPNLVYFRYGTDTEYYDNRVQDLNLEGCSNLDIPTLEETLVRFVHFGTLTIQTSVWNNLSEEVRTHCTNNRGTINLVD